MRWFQQRTRLGARLALFALALHSVLSFGHVHPDVLSQRAGSVIAGATESDTDAAPSSGNPAHPYRNSTAHDFCAVCGSLSLFGSIVLPDASLRMTLRAFDRVGFWHVLTNILSRPYRSLSEARAPPFT
jgi:hypothetical protein